MSLGPAGCRGNHQRSFAHRFQLSFRSVGFRIYAFPILDDISYFFADSSGKRGEKLWGENRCHCRCRCRCWWWWCAFIIVALWLCIDRCDVCVCVCICMPLTYHFPSPVGIINSLCTYRAFPFDPSASLGQHLASDICQFGSFFFVLDFAFGINRSGLKIICCCYNWSAIGLIRQFYEWLKARVSGRI